MTFRGYFALAGEELSNSSRTLAHLEPPVPTRDDQIGDPSPLSCLDCRTFKIGYDDTWPGLQAALGDDPYVLTDAPWYTPARPESAEFAGIWVMEVTGLDAVPVQRSVAEAVGDGGAADRFRANTRKITFSVLVVACTNAGARFGLQWLNCLLKKGHTRLGVPLELYTAHPEDTAAPAASLRRTLFNVITSKSAAVTELSGRGGGAAHRQASVLRVEFEMVALSPYLYGPATEYPVTWDSIADESITWAHAPDCTSEESCGLPTIFNAECAPPDIPIDLGTAPSCGGCLPVCTLEQRTWQMPTSVGYCDDTTVSVHVENTGAVPLTVNFFWRPCGSTDPCEEAHRLQVSGLPAGMTAVADAVSGRAHVLSGGQVHRQVGIVSTPSGAPWRSMVIDTAFCWELVAESVPDADYVVTVITRDRDA